MFWKTPGRFFVEARLQRQKSKLYKLLAYASLFESRPSNEKKMGKTHLFCWRRGQDSNLRYVSVHNISNVAPSTSQTPLRVESDITFNLLKYYIRRI